MSIESLVILELAPAGVQLHCIQAREIHTARSFLCLVLVHQHSASSMHPGFQRTSLALTIARRSVADSHSV